MSGAAEAEAALAPTTHSATASTPASLVGFITLILSVEVFVLAVETPPWRLPRRGFGRLTTVRGIDPHERMCASTALAARAAA